MNGNYLDDISNFGKKERNLIFMRKVLLWGRGKGNQLDFDRGIEIQKIPVVCFLV